jgi:hypothetical protein
MPHRDDHEAARHRIAALEQQLAETEAQAQRAVAEANARAEQAERRAASRKEPEPTPAHAKAGWPTARRQRFLRATMITAAVLDLPVVVLLAGWRWNLDGADSDLLGWTFLPPIVLAPFVYLFARKTRAPFPASTLPIQLVATGVGYLGVLCGASDLFWHAAYADPPARWVTRGLSGLVGIAFHAITVAHWCAEAALTETTGSD